MPKISPPTLYVLAGPNGAGKSSITPTLGLTCPVMNPDAMVRAILEQRLPNAPADYRPTPLEYTRALREVQHEIRTNFQTYMTGGNSFAIETTLSGQSIYNQIRQAQALGFKLHLYYVMVETVALSKLRVAQRLKAGGHGIPEADIYRRRGRCRDNFHRLAPIIDAGIVFDNSLETGIRPLAYKSMDTHAWQVLDPALPWLTDALTGCAP